MLRGHLRGLLLLAAVVGLSNVAFAQEDPKLMPSGSYWTDGECNITQG
jgi:hypothetical protein